MQVMPVSNLSAQPDAYATPAIYATSMPVVIATRDGPFHPGEIIGVAILQIVFPNHEIIRTSDPQQIARANFAVKASGPHEATPEPFERPTAALDDPSASGGAYDSAKSVWDDFGAHCLAPWSKYLSEQDVADIVAVIDDELMQHFDLAGAGASYAGPVLFGLPAVLSNFNSTWFEENCMEQHERDDLALERFRDAALAAGQLLRRILASKVSEATASNLVRNSQRLMDGRVLLLGDSGMPWRKVVCNELPDVLLVLCPDGFDGQYQIRTVPINPQSLAARADLPHEWAGSREGALVRLTGIADAVACDRACSFAQANSFSGAQALAALALRELGIAVAEAG